MAITLEQIKQERLRRAGLQRISDERARRQQPIESPPTQETGGAFPIASPELLQAAQTAVQSQPSDEQIKQRNLAEREAKAATAEGEAANQRTVDRMRSIITEGPQLAGSMAGGIIGSPLGLKGSAVGASVLGGAGRVLGESARLLVGTEEEKEAARQKPFFDLVKDIAIKSGKSGAEEGLWDLGGGVIAKGAGKLFSPIIKNIAPRASAMMDVFREAGGKFSVAELDRRGLLQFLESASRNSLEGKELFKKFIDEPSNRALIKMTKLMAGDMAEGVGKLEPDMVADALVNSIKGIDSSFDEVFGPAWTQLDDLTRTSTVETAGLKDFAEKEIFELAEIESIGGSAELEGILNKVDKLGPFVSFKGMRRIKRDLLRQVKSLNVSGDVADGVAKKLAGLAEEALLDPKTVKGAGKEVQLLHSNLKAAYRTGKTAFSEAFPSKIIDGLSDPARKSAVIKRMFPDNGIDNIKNIRGTLTETLQGKPNKDGIKTWGQLQRTWYEDLVARSMNSKGDFVSSKLEQNIKKFGPKAVKEILGPEQAKSLRLIRGIAKEKGAEKSNLAFLVRSIQIGGAATALSGFKGENDPVTIGLGGTVALTPAIFALLSGSKSGNALLRAGLKLPKGSKALPGIVLKLNAAIRRERNKNKPTQTKRPTVSPSAELQL